jgi:uncharacterized membrane protein
MVVLLIAGGALLRIWGLGAHRFNYDESFTAMTGRHALGSLFDYLRHQDSHPPLDYLARAPLARAGVTDLWFRMPSVLFSLAALSLFAFWSRRHGLAGVIAVGLMAMSAFQIEHGRDARMYAELELIGVASAVVADAWWRRSARWHAPAIGALVFAGLLTHVSMILVGVGLLVLAGWRRDREAWRWRFAVVGGGAVAAALWGPSFLVQARGGHSSWIPRTSLGTLASSIGRLVTYRPEFYSVVLLAMLGGFLVLRTRDRSTGRVWACCFAVPVGAAAIAGLAAPVVLDRTFTLVAWAPLTALGFLVAQLAQRTRVGGAVAIGVLVAVMMPSTVSTLTRAHGPDEAMKELRSVTRPGDVVAAYPAWRGVQTEWAIGVQSGLRMRNVEIAQLPNTDAFALGDGPLSRRVWLWPVDAHAVDVPAFKACTPTSPRSTSRIVCLTPTQGSELRPLTR